MMANDTPRLHTPAVEEILQKAMLTSPGDVTCAAMLDAMRVAASVRVEEVASKRQREEYEHAPSLAVQCAQLDEPEKGRRWLASLIDEYRRSNARSRPCRGAHEGLDGAWGKRGVESCFMKGILSCPHTASYFTVIRQGVAFRSNSA